MNKLYSALIITLFFFTVTPIVALGQVQSWDVQLKPSQRFSLLKDFNDEAVLDNETGLVWERAPDATERQWNSPFTGAVDTCFSEEIGGRLGWRLPTVAELTSLIDPSQNQPALPPGHPFLNIQIANDPPLPDAYWTSTSDGDPSVIADRAYKVIFRTGGIGVGTKVSSTNNFAWCVRGGQGHDAPN